MPMTETMRALVIERTGDAGELHLAEVPRPTRVNDEVLVRVVAAGVNPIDAKTRVGRGVAAAIGSFPVVLGNDFAGVVETVPYAAHPLQPGDRVYGMGRVPRTGGSYAEFVSISSMSVAPMPASLGFIEAAGVPLAALTAWGAVIDTARAHDGQRMLIHAGAGGVGHFAVQLASYFGAVVTATCSAENVEFVRGLGARHVIDYRAQRFEDVAGEQDVVIDLIGNAADDTGSRSLEVLRPHGLIVNVPSRSWPSMAEEATARGIRSTGYSVSPDARTLAVITRLIDDGSIRVHVERELPLEEGAEAHRMLEEGHMRGKVVLRVAPDPEVGNPVVE
jgi:NADPH:quinone reductase-like Zn-dependent oxidoreductase